jgi:hypothetical protein
MGNVTIEFKKDHLKIILLCYGEIELANKVEDLSNQDIKNIGGLAAKYIVKCNLVDQTIAYGAVEFMEGIQRPLKRIKRDMKYYRN